MPPKFLLLLLSVLLAACAPPDEGRYQTLVGAVLIDGTGAPPVEHSVIIIDGATIRAVGTQAHTPIPKGGKNIDLTGKYVTPSGSGTLEPGKPASLKVYRSNPLQAPEAPGEAESEMVDGQWIVRK